jgi:hypothetical protein
MTLFGHVSANIVSVTDGAVASSGNDQVLTDR